MRTGLVSEIPPCHATKCFVVLAIYFVERTAVKGRHVQLDMGPGLRVIILNVMKRDLMKDALGGNPANTAHGTRGTTKGK